MPLGAFGAFVVILMIVAAIFAPVLSPYDPEMNNFEAMFKPPSFEYLWVPTSSVEISPDCYGAQTALFVGLPAPLSAHPLDWCSAS